MRCVKFVLSIAAALLALPTFALANNTFPGTAISGINTNFTASNVGATGETGEPATYGGGSLNTMWYTWTAPGNGTVTFETCGTAAQTNFDTTLQSFTGTPVSSLTLLASNDDTTGCAAAGVSSYGSRITWNVTQGTDYRIQLDGYGSATGTAARVAYRFTGFTVAKSASVSSIAAPGTITYTINVANAGYIALTGTSITDALLLSGAGRTLTSGPTLVSGDAAPLGTLGTAETWVYQATFAVPQSDIDLGGTYSNTATFDTAETVAATSNAATTSITQSPSFTNVKSQFSGPSPVVAAGNVIGYRITIANTGNLTLTAPTVVSDTFQLGGAARTLTSAPAYASGDADSDGRIDVGETWIYSASYTVPQSDIDGTGSFTNTATFDTAQTAPLASNTVTTNVTRTPSFSIAKTQSAGPSPITAAGQTMTYTITVVNTGNQSLTAPTISDTLLLGASARTLTTGPTLASGDSAPLGTLNVGETWIYNATYLATQADIDGTGNYANTATFDTAQTAPLTSGTVTTNVTRAPALAIDKTYVITTDGGSPGVADLNDVITYTYAVSNTGNVTINGVSVSDVHNGYGSLSAITPASVASLAPGASTNFTATYTAVQGDIDNP